MDVYAHGVQIEELSTALQPMIQVAAPVTVIGTANSGPVNEPTLITSYSNFVETFLANMGGSTAYDDFTLHEAAYVCFRLFNVSPLICINVLNPASHFKSSSQDLSGLTEPKTIKSRIIPGTLVVTSGSVTLEEGTDYTFADSVLTIKNQSKVTDDTVHLAYHLTDVSKVTTDNVIGAVHSSTGKKTGLAVLEDVYPKLGLVPGVVIAPHYSEDPEVALAMAARVADIDGCFRTVAVADLPAAAAALTNIKENPVDDLAVVGRAIGRV